MRLVLGGGDYTIMALGSVARFRPPAIGKTRRLHTSFKIRRRADNRHARGTAEAKPRLQTFHKDALELSADFGHMVFRVQGPKSVHLQQQ